jgi:NAD(P)-dependent dehydrogenase (short-subunit alcohol dehydrogenase family)
MDLKLVGKTALITGASKGIGGAAAEMLAAEGCHLVLVARTAGDLARAKDSIARKANVSVETVPADLSDSANVTRLAREFPDIDILVNNAGAIPGGKLLDIDEATWRSAWDLKVFGYINMCRAFYALMKTRHAGVITFVPPFLLPRSFASRIQSLADRSVVVRAVVREGKQGELNTLNCRSAKPAEFLCLTFMPERCAGIFISSLTANWMAPMVVPAKPTSTLAATNPSEPTRAYVRSAAIRHEGEPAFAAHVLRVALGILEPEPLNKRWSQQPLRVSPPGCPAGLTRASTGSRRRRGRRPPRQSASAVRCPGQGSKELPFIIIARVCRTRGRGLRS